MFHVFRSVHPSKSGVSCMSNEKYKKKTNKHTYTRRNERNSCSLLNKRTFVKWKHIRNMLALVASSAFILSLHKWLCLLLITSTDKLATYHLYAWACFARYVVCIVWSIHLLSALCALYVRWFAFVVLIRAFGVGGLFFFSLHYAHSSSEGGIPFFRFYNNFNMKIKRIRILHGSTKNVCMSYYYKQNNMYSI